MAIKFRLVREGRRNPKLVKLERFRATDSREAVGRKNTPKTKQKHNKQNAHEENLIDIVRETRIAVELEKLHRDERTRTRQRSHNIFTRSPDAT